MPTAPHATRADSAIRRGAAVAARLRTVINVADRTRSIAADRCAFLNVWARQFWRAELTLLRRPGDLPPPAVQLGLQLIDLIAWTVGEDADWAPADHDLADWVDDVWQLRSNLRRG